MKQSHWLWLAIGAVVLYFLFFHHQTKLGQSQAQGATAQNTPTGMNS